MDENKNVKSNTDTNDAQSTPTPGTTPEAPATGSQEGEAIPNSAAPTEPATATGATTTDEPGGATGMIIGAIIVALILIGAAWWVMSDTDRSVESDQLGQNGLMGEVEEGEPTDVVAVVNGTELTRAEFNRVRQQVMQNAQQQGADINDPSVMQQINNQAMDTLVNTEIVRQAAVAAGVTVSGADVDARYEQIVQSVGGADELADSLAQLGITEESLRGDVEQELVVQAYLDQSVTEEFSVTDGEVQEFYEELGGQEAGLPPIEEVREQIEQQLLMSQENEVIEQLLEELRASAEIEILL